MPIVVFLLCSLVVRTCICVLLSFNLHLCFTCWGLLRLILMTCNCTCIMHTFLLTFFCYIILGCTYFNNLIVTTQINCLIFKTLCFKCPISDTFIWNNIRMTIFSLSCTFFTIHSSSLENQYDTRFLDGALPMIAKLVFASAFFIVVVLSHSRRSVA